jgi:uncharacterized protein (TIGR03435 family)
MPDANDIALLQEYLDRNSETAFAGLVQRHINLVYSVALRFTGNSPDAQDVTQAVFIILAQKAASLRQRTTLTGWLYETTRFTARQLLRTRARQQAREQEAYMQSTLNDPNSENVWRQLAPQLEEAMARLSEKERTLVALRFFENKSAAETAALLGIQEWAAHKRAARAMEKLRQFFVKRGITSTTATLAGAISANSVQAAPTMLAKAVTATAIAKGAAASGSTLTLIKGALKIMAWTKMKTAIVAGVVVLLAAGTTTITVKEIQWHRIDDSIWDKGQADTRILDKAPHIVRIIPTKFPNAGGWAVAPNWKVLGVGGSVQDLVNAAYKGRLSRTIFPESLPTDRYYDFIANLPTGNEVALQNELKKQFGIVAHKEVITTNVLFLKVKIPNVQGLKLTTSKNGPSIINQGHLQITNMRLANFAGIFESQIGIPVIDQTGLNGKFDVDLQWDNKNDLQHENLKQAIADQLGLELVPGTAPVEFLIVEKVN